MSAHDGRELAILLRAIGVARRRAFVCVCAQTIVLASCGIVLAFEVTLVTGHAASASAIALTAGVLFVAALVAAVLRTPSVTATAARLDRHFALADRLVTALESQDRTDAFSRLVIRDAALHVSRVTPAAAFRVEWPRAAAWAAIAAMVLPLAAVFGGTSAGSSTGFAPGSTVVSASPGARTATDHVARTASRQALQAQAPAADPRISEPHGGSSSPEPTHVPDLNAPSPAAPLAGAGQAGRTQAGNSASEGGDGSAAGRGTYSGTPGRATVSGAPIEARTSYAAAWASAESATAQERVPARLRPYVRRYLDAIRQDHP